MQLIQDIGPLLKTHVGFLIVNLPACTRAAAPLYRIGALIAPDQLYDDLAMLLSFAYKLILTVRQVPKKGKADRFHERRLARPICSTDCSRTSSELHDDMAITLNILQLKARYEHASSANLPSKREKYGSPIRYSPSLHEKRKYSGAL